MNKMQLQKISSDVFTVSVGCVSMAVELDSDDERHRLVLRDMVDAYNDAIEFRTAKERHAESQYNNTL